MALTQVSTDGVKNDAITKTKIPANQIEASELADNAVDTNAIADQAVALSKLPHGDGSSDGKFLRANNGADPSFETVTSTTINNNADNRLITGSGSANTLNGESSLTFDGTQLTSTSALFGSGNVSKAQDGVIIQRNSSSGSAEIVAGRSGGNYGQMQFYVAGASGVTNRHQIDYQSNFLWYDEDGSTEMMRLDNTGKVGIGKNNPAFLLEIKGATTDTIRLNHSGESSSGSHDVKIVAGGAHYQNIHFEGSNIFYKTYNGSSVGERFRIRSTGGVTFNGDTADANALDDYEEGTYTPQVIIGGGTSGVTQPTNRYGSYTKIGRRVFFNLWINGTVGYTGSIYHGLQITLPFTTNSSNAHYSALSVWFYAGVTDEHKVISRTENNDNKLILQYPGDGIAFQRVDGTWNMMISGQFDT